MRKAMVLQNKQMYKITAVVIPSSVSVSERDNFLSVASSILRCIDQKFISAQNNFDKIIKNFKKFFFFQYLH